MDVQTLIRLVIDDETWWSKNQLWWERRAAWSGQAEVNRVGTLEGEAKRKVDPVELLQLQNISEGLSTVHLSLCGSL